MAGYSIASLRNLPYDFQREAKIDYLRRRYRSSHMIKNDLLRLFVFNIDDNKCIKCGSIDNLTIDHIISVYSGGSNDFSNLQTLCNKCNAGKAP